MPTQLTLQPDGGAPVTVAVPPITDTATPNGTVTVPLKFAPITARQLRVTVSAVRPESTIEYFSRSPLELPVSIAELGIPGARVAAAPATVPSECRSDLLTVDGKPVGVRFVGQHVDGRAARHPRRAAVRPGDRRRDTAGSRSAPASTS